MHHGSAAAQAGRPLAREKREFSPMPHWLEITRETLLIAWVTAILFGLVVYRRERKKSADAFYSRYRMILKCLLQIVSFGAIFSTIGVLQRINEAGLIPDGLKWFLIAMVLLLALTQHLLEHYALPMRKGSPTKDVAPGSAA
jgi:hypothetical protein